HHELDRVEGVGAQVVDEVGLGGHLGGVRPELLDDDLLDAVRDAVVRHLGLRCCWSRHMYPPPLTLRQWPVMYEESSLHKNSTERATSMGSPMRPTRILPMTFCFSASGMASVRRVRMKPGATALTRMLREANSRAQALVSEIRPPF